MLELQDVPAEVASALAAGDFSPMKVKGKELYSTTLRAKRSGRVSRLGARSIALACQLLGASRTQPGAPIDHNVGVRLEKVLGAWVSTGAPWITIYHRQVNKLSLLIPRTAQNFRLGTSARTVSRAG